MLGVQEGHPEQETPVDIISTAFVLASISVGDGPGPFQQIHGVGIFDQTAQTIAFLGWFNDDQAQLISYSASASLASYDTRITIQNTCEEELACEPLYFQGFTFSSPFLGPLEEAFFIPLAPIVLPPCDGGDPGQPRFDLTADDPAPAGSCTITIDPPAWDATDFGPIGFDHVAWQWSGDPDENVPPEILQALYVVDVHWIEQGQESSPDVLGCDPCAGGQILYPDWAWWFYVVSTWDWYCVGDVNVDGRVGMLDLMEVMTGWGSAMPAGLNDIESNDIDQSGSIDMQDIGYVLANWGACP